MVHFTISDQGTEVPAEADSGVHSRSDTQMSDGDLLLVSPAHDIRVGSVAIAGHIRHPGPRSLAEAELVAGLLAGADLLPDPYLPFAALETTDPATLARVMVPIDLQGVIDGRADPMLSADDILIVLGSNDIAFLSSTPVVKLLRDKDRKHDKATKARARHPLGLRKRIAPVSGCWPAASPPIARELSREARWRVRPPILPPCRCPAPASSTTIRTC